VQIIIEGIRFPKTVGETSNFYQTPSHLHVIQLLTFSSTNDIFASIKRTYINPQYCPIQQPFTMGSFTSCLDDATTTICITISTVFDTQNGAKHDNRVHCNCYCSPSTPWPWRCHAFSSNSPLLVFPSG
jgi:hypothetical protein